MQQGARKLKAADGALRPAAKLNQVIDKRWAAYALAAGAAGVALLITAPPAEADIVYTHSNATWSGGLLNIDMNNSGVADFQIIGASRTHAIQARIRATQPQGFSLIAVSFSASALPKGAMIGPGAGFENANASTRSGRRGELIVGFGLVSDTTYGQFAGQSHDFLGVRFEINGQEHYGWVGISFAGYSNRLEVELNGYAYNTVPNQGLYAGETPEPGTLGLLALGILGLGLWRRKRTATA